MKLLHSRWRVMARLEISLSKMASKCSFTQVNCAFSNIFSSIFRRSPIRRQRLHKSIILATTLSLSLSSLPLKPAEAARINARNNIYFVDEDDKQANAHEVDSLVYGEALYHFFSEQPFQALTAIRRVEIDDQAKEQVDIYAQILAASLSAEMGMSNHAKNYLAQATGQSRSSRSDKQLNALDIEQISFFLAQIDYEQGEFNKAIKALNQIKRPELLTDPDALAAYKVNSILNASDKESKVPKEVFATIDTMRPSPWRSYARLNTALFFLRQNDYDSSIEPLTTAIEEINGLSSLSAYDYWYKRGLTYQPIMTDAAFDAQNLEVGRLKEKILITLAYAHLEIASQLDDPKPFFEHIAAAEKAIYALPVDSSYAHHALEMLTQTLLAGLRAPEKSTLLSTDEDAQKAIVNKVMAILKKLVAKDQPRITRLRSMLALVSLEDKYRYSSASLRYANTFLDYMNTERQAINDFLQQTDEQVLETLKPVLSYSIKQASTHWQLDSIIQKLPLDTNSFISWVTTPKIKQYTEELAFFLNADAMLKDWRIKKPFLLDELQANSNLARQAGMAQLAQMTQQNEALSRALAQDAKYSPNNPLKRFVSKHQSLQRGPNSTADSSLAEFKYGLALWQASANSPMTKLSKRAELDSMNTLLINNQTIAQKIQRSNQPITVKQRRQLNAQFKLIDTQMNQLDNQITQALNETRQLIVTALKSQLKSELEYVETAVFHLMLEKIQLLEKVDQ